MNYRGFQKDIRIHRTKDPREKLKVENKQNKTTKKRADSSGKKGSQCSRAPLFILSRRIFFFLISRKRKNSKNSFEGKKTPRFLTKEQKYGWPYTSIIDVKIQRH